MCCTCNCHWGGERTGFLVLERSCFSRAKLFRWFEIWKQTSLGETGCLFAVQSNADGEGSRKNPFQTGVTFFRALILGVGSLPADASVWLGIAKNICNGHQGNGLTLLHTHSNHICTEFSSSCIWVIKVKNMDLFTLKWQQGFIFPKLASKNHALKDEFYVEIPHHIFL